MLKLFPRGEFEQAVKEHKAERHARGFTSWGQFMAMLFCQLGLIVPDLLRRGAERVRGTRAG